ncbi:MAG: aconitase family protein [Planctomycetota bacterium]|nr:aconitase family protein [Planctomycetota bacterium]
MTVPPTVPSGPPPAEFRLTPGKRILFLTRDPDLIRRQLAGERDLRMADLDPADLLDEINTDTMTPAWVCFRHRPQDLARDAYAGLIVDGKRVFETDALWGGGFEVIVAGLRKGVGSSRETAVQAEKWSGIRLSIADSFAPIHERNLINQGVLTGGYDVVTRLQAGEGIPLAEFLAPHDPITREIVRAGGLFAFSKGLREGTIEVPAHDTAKRPMTIGEKIIASHLVGDVPPYVQPGDAVVARVDGGYSHEFTTAQVHVFLEEEFGPDYQLADPRKFAVFEDHLIYADEVAKMRPFMDQIEILRDLQRAFQQHTGVQDFSARDGVSPGICHQVAREHIIEPGDFIQATDSHTCMGGASNALAYGVGTTEYAALVHSGITLVEVPESIRFELHGTLQPGVTAKDVMLYILLHHAKPQHTLNRVMEFGGPGLATLSLDERATLANMATECTARAGVVEGDEALIQWIAARRPGADLDALRAGLVAPDPGARYHGGVHRIDLDAIQPMVATPGDPDEGVPSDPTNGALVADLGEVRIDIAYGGSCTAGKEDDLDMYAAVMAEARDAGLRVAEGVQFFIQFGSESVAAYARDRGYLDVFAATGVRIIQPGCGACIGCGPGVSERGEQVTVSAINRNFQGRSGPGRLYLASPLTVAASAVTGRITAWHPGLFALSVPAGA